MTIWVRLAVPMWHIVSKLWAPYLFKLSSCLDLCNWANWYWSWCLQMEHTIGCSCLCLADVRNCYFHATIHRYIQSLQRHSIMPQWHSGACWCSYSIMALVGQTLMYRPKSWCWQPWCWQCDDKVLGVWSSQNFIYMTLPNMTKALSPKWRLFCFSHHSDWLGFMFYSASMESMRICRQSA